MRKRPETVCLLAAILLTMTFSNQAMAQPPEGGPPPFGRGEGPGGRFQPPPLTAAMVPVETLDAFLNLTDAQEQKIRAIGDRLRSQMPRPPAPPREGMGERNTDRPMMPSREEMEAQRAKMETARKKATTEINAVLTAEQKKKLPGILKALSALRPTGFDLRATPKLKLTAPQMTKLASLGDTGTPDKVNTVLTAQQRTVIAANQRRRGPGGPGGPGRFGGSFPAGRSQAPPPF